MSNEIQKSGGQPGGAVSPFALQQQAGGALANIASNAAVMETMASIYIAKQFPRDLGQVTAKMEMACSRKSLAEAATYSYPRGGQSVTGPSIRLAECLIACYGNSKAGWHEVSRRFDAGKQCGVSECVAYAFDEECNNRKEIAFTVPHWRDTKQGGYELKDERDIYELCANMAARRVRACILAILPAWLVEEALECVDKTLEAADGKRPIADVVRSMQAKFSAIGVTREMLEANLGHPLEQCTRDEVRRLAGNYTAISNGDVRASDVFKMPEAPQEPVEPEIAGKAKQQQPQQAQQPQGSIFGEEMGA